MRASRRNIRIQVAISTEVLTIDVVVPPDHSGRAGTLTGLALRQGTVWIAVCRELGTVAQGDTAEEALFNLEAAVADVLEIAAEDGLPSGSPVSATELRDLLLSHQGPEARVQRSLRGL